jgi:hypothetical protein
MIQKTKKNYGAVKRDEDATKFSNAVEFEFDDVAWIPDASGLSILCSSLDLRSAISQQSFAVSSELNSRMFTDSIPAVCICKSLAFVAIAA